LSFGEIEIDLIFLIFFWLKLWKNEYLSLSFELHFLVLNLFVLEKLLLNKSSVLCLFIEALFSRPIVLSYNWFKYTKSPISIFSSNLSSFFLSFLSNSAFNFGIKSIKDPFLPKKYVFNCFSNLINESGFLFIASFPNVLIINLVKYCSWLFIFSFIFIFSYVSWF
jgi:hypothetical protein